MATKHTTDLTEALHAWGVRKKLAKKLGELDGNKLRSGAKGEKGARQAADDLTTAASEIRARVLTTDPKRRAAGKKGAQTRKRTAAKRRASAKQGASTRAKVARARSSSR